MTIPPGPAQPRHRLPAADTPPEPPPPPRPPSPARRRLLGIGLKVATSSSLLFTIIDGVIEGEYLRAGVAGALLAGGVLADQLRQRWLRYPPTPTVDASTTPSSTDTR